MFKRLLPPLPRLHNRSKRSRTFQICSSHNKTIKCPITVNRIFSGLLQDVRTIPCRLEYLQIPTRLAWRSRFRVSAASPRRAKRCTVSAWAKSEACRRVVGGSLPEKGCVRSAYFMGRNHLAYSMCH